MILSRTDLATYQALVEAAEANRYCPTNRAMADQIGFGSATTIGKIIPRLVAAKLITIEQHGTRRRITITATGKRTAGEVVVREVRAYRSVEERPFNDSEIAARSAADQAQRRAERERWLDLEQQRYSLPRRGRLIDGMPA